MALRADPDGIAPERAIVFEVAGSLADFYSQASRIAGLEFLLEDDTEIEPDDDFYGTKTVKGVTLRQDAPLGGRLYMAMPDLRALKEILKLWDLHRKNRPMPHGFSQWNTLFDLLHDVRAWGPADRVLPETLAYWREQLDADPGRPVRFEVELWFHEIDRRRAVAEAAIRAQVTEYGGTFISGTQIAPIRYHGMLVDMPAARIAELLDNRDVTDSMPYAAPDLIRI